MRYTIREARADDLRSLAAIETAADGLFPAGRIPEPSSTYPVEGLEQALREGLLLVAELDQDVVGFAVAEVMERALHLWVLAVHPSFGRRGIGTDLVAAVIAESKQRGLAGVTLTTFADVTWNAPFYAKLGFRMVSKEERSVMIAAALQHEAASGMVLRIAMCYQNGV